MDELGSDAKSELIERLKELRIFDPAVGSGEFLFSMLIALQRALTKLDRDAPNPAADIIRRQLSGQDINPLAVQITRLRLFIAITAARRNNTDDAPLPNLEARIVCADTLATVADPEWRPDRPDQLADADPELIDALTDTAQNRARWFDAHTEDDKQALLQRDADLRNRVKLLLNQNRSLASPELVEFVDSPIYAANPRPAKTDARLLFYENPWRGFDIVIGNPPYEALSKSMDAAGRKRLADAKRYKTTNVGDLYSLFCETALALANPDGGVVTLIVPLSISFGRQQETLRGVFESRCKEIELRHYDNNPGRTFTNTPTVRDVRNNQRISILVAKISNRRQLVIKSTGQQRWPVDEREMCVAQRGTAVLPSLPSKVDKRISSQWGRIPTPEVASMISALASQRKKVGEYVSSDGEILTLPKTARYFISCIPEGSVNQRSEDRFSVANMDDLCLLMAVLNGHIGYGWWRVYGDGFHLNAYELLNLTVPDTWVKNPQDAIAVGRRLIDAMPDCITLHPREGVDWENVNFHRIPKLIEELDRMHLEALGFTGQAQDTLLTHLRIMRSSSSWNFGG